MSIPARLLEVPQYDTGRYSPEWRAKCLRRLKPLPASWHPPHTEGRRPIGNLLLAVKDNVASEMGETRTAIRDLSRKATALRRHLGRLQKAKQVGEDAG